MQLNNTLFTINFTIYNEKQDLKNQTLECCGKVCRGWFSHVSETSSLVDGCLDDVRAAVLNKNKKWYHKLFNTLTSVCTFSILFFIHLPRCLQGEFVYQSRDSMVGDNFLYIPDLNVWSKANTVRRNYKGSEGHSKERVYRFNWQQSHKQIPENRAIYLMEIY